MQLDALSYRVLDVDPSHRNVARRLRHIFAGWHQAEELASWQKVLAPGGLGRQDLLRVQLCVGPHMSSYLGMWSEEPFSSADEARLQTLVPALRRAVERMQMWNDAGWLSAGLAAAMDALAVPAMLVDGRGHVRHANGQARELWLARGSRPDFLEPAALVAPPAWLDVTPVSAPGQPLLYLVKSRGDRSGGGRVNAFARDHGLTPRQTQVLSLILEGHANKAVAARIGISIRTVELHVSRVLQTVGVGCRAALVARVLSS
ncbi:MAG: helix-turn-helix transcriptional regulator [Myxococcales bacterium]|nr:helix-turn-helix transcriptional regulator [Myxococcales bacterium]